MFQSGDIAFYLPKNGASGLEKVTGAITKSRDDGRKREGLLWGDEVYVTEVRRTRATVAAKGRLIDVSLSRLSPDRILSMSQIDCGQGDGALINFPDGKWMLVDGGPPAGKSNSGGDTAISFLKWKLFVDQSWRKKFKVPGRFRIDALVCTHPDEDHYGAFQELVPLIRSGILEVGTFFHNGMGRFSGPYRAFENGSGFSQLGPIKGKTLPQAWLTRLIDDFGDVKRYLEAKASRPWKLSGNYSKLLKQFLELEGNGIEKMQRVDHSTGKLPGFEDITVLGPLIEKWKDKPAMRYLDTGGVSRMKSPSLTRNGQSVVMRLDFNKLRILLTGDLNFRSQALLLKHHGPEPFNCDIAKACHHGSEDISWKFCEAMNPIATLFSSGDNEAHAHPRAKALGLSAAFSRRLEDGRKMKYDGFSEPNLLSPLIYSTEISRSSQLSKIYGVFQKDGTRILAPQIQARGRTSASRAKGKRKKMSDWLLADRLTYGLINVRTDGKRVVIGVRKEGGPGFQTESFSV